METPAVKYTTYVESLINYLNIISRITFKHHTSVATIHTFPPEHLYTHINTQPTWQPHAASHINTVTQAEQTVTE